jgi:hypothetical protein
LRRYSASFALTLPPTRPPNRGASALTPHIGQIVRKYEKAERQHPEPQNRQKSQSAAYNQGAADGDPAEARARHWKMPTAKRQSASAVIHPKTLRFLAICHVADPFSWSVRHLQMVRNGGQNKRRTFF